MNILNKSKLKISLEKSRTNLRFAISINAWYILSPKRCNQQNYIIDSAIVLSLHREFIFICLYMYCRWRSSYQEGRVGIPFTGLTLPHYLPVQRQDGTWISNVICFGLFCAQWFKVRGDCSFWWYWWNQWFSDCVFGAFRPQSQCEKGSFFPNFRRENSQ